MTLWLANLAAYSIQLAALVGTGAVIVSLLRVTAPRATLRFWQILFASIVLWPMYQLWATADTSPEVLSGGVVWSLAASSATGMRASVAAIDAGVASLVMGALAAGAAIRLGWLGLGLARLRSFALPRNLRVSWRPCRRRCSTSSTSRRTFISRMPSAAPPRSARCARSCCCRDASATWRRRYSAPCCVTNCFTCVGGTGCRRSWKNYGVRCSGFIRPRASWRRASVWRVKRSWTKRPLRIRVTAAPTRQRCSNSQPLGRA